MIRTRAMVGLLASVVCSSAAHATCTDALVESTYSRLSTSDQNYQLATLVTEDTYDKLKRNAGASGQIYGVPVGANYDEYRRSRSQRLNSRQESWSSSQMTNVLWTGLDPNAASAYARCLDAEVFNQDGLHAAVVGASASEILIKVRWNVRGRRDSAVLEWTTPTIEDVTLPTQVTQGERIIRIPRPSTPMALAANYRGYATETIYIDPLPEPTTSLSIAQQIAAGRPFIFVTDPSTTLGVSSPRIDVNSLSSLPTIINYYQPTRRSWVSWGHGRALGAPLYASRTDCGQEQCDPPAVPYCWIISGPNNRPCAPLAMKLLNPTDQRPPNQQPPHHIDPLSGKVVVMGMILDLREDGRAFSADGVQRGFVAVPEFANEGAPAPPPMMGS